jgi:tetratricopeptide (TPR) repeat protein
VGDLAQQPRTVAAIAGQIAGALAAAHDKGIIHRDLKPDNVFLAPASPAIGAAIHVKILDFGIAKLLGEETAEIRKTRTGSLLGTPLYMSPEQCRGTGRIDHRTDIYSLGCMIFQAVSGRPPFVREGVGELIAAHLSEPAPELSSLAPSVPPALGGLVGRMLAKDPDQRPASMAEVVRELEALLGVPSAGFLALIALPDDFPIRMAADVRSGGADGAPSRSGAARARTQVMPPSQPVTSPAVGRTQVRPDQPVSARVESEADAPPPEPPAPRRLTLNLGFAAGLLVIVGLIVAAGLLYAHRWGYSFSSSRPLARDPATEVRGPQPPDPAALAAIAPFLQAGIEPAFPDGCRTADGDTLRGLARAARDLAPGATEAARARAMAALDALADGTPERWMIAARATLAGDPKRAEQASARAVSLCASSAVAENLHGNALQILEQLAPAQAAYRAAIRLAPGYAAPRFNLGLLQLRGDDARAALAIFDELARANADYPNIHLVRAEAHRRLGDRAAATADLEEQVRRQPDSAEGWLQLGRALSARDRARARAAFCRAQALGDAAAAPLCAR